MDFIIFVCFSGTQSSTSDWIGKIGSESRSLRSSPYLEVRRGGSDAAERVGAIPRCGPEQRSLWSKYSFGCDCSWCCRGTPRCEASVPFSAEALRVSASSISVICYRGRCFAPVALFGVLFDEVSFVHALIFSGSGRRTLHPLHLHFLIGAALQVIGVAVCLPRSSHGRHRRHCPCQHCKHQRRYTGVLLPSAPLLCGSISGSRLAVSSVVAVSPLLVSLALLLSVFHLRFHSPGITSGPLSCFTPQSYYLPAERQGQVCTSCSSVFRFVAKRLSPLPHGPQRRHFSGSVKQKNNEPYV